MLTYMENQQIFSKIFKKKVVRKTKKIFKAKIKIEIKLILFKTMELVYFFNLSAIATSIGWTDIFKKDA